MRIEYGISFALGLERVVMFYPLLLPCFKFLLFETNCEVATSTSDLLTPDIYYLPLNICSNLVRLK